MRDALVGSGAIAYSKPAMGTVAFHDVDPGRAASLRVLQRALGGEVFILRQLMQRAGIQDPLTAGRIVKPLNPLTKRSHGVVEARSGSASR